MSEWGNPLRLGNQISSSMVECIDHVKLTQGTETSKYLLERKSTETPLVAASESGYSPNREACFPGLWALNNADGLLDERSGKSDHRR